MVPVATKPFMNRVILPKMQRESLHFFLLITKKISQFITSCENRVAGITTSALRDGLANQFQYISLWMLEFYK